MRVPAGVQPGHWPLRVWYLIGHSKGRWARPGKATEMEQEQSRPCAMTARPRLLPTMRAETGLPRKEGPPVEPRGALAGGGAAAGDGPQEKGAGGVGPKAIPGGGA
jgi:hypothetical protein